MANIHCPGYEGGQSVLERRGMNGNLWTSIGMMALFVLGYRFLAFFALSLRTRFAK